MRSATTIPRLSQCPWLLTVTQADAAATPLPRSLIVFRYTIHAIVLSTESVIYNI